MAEIRLPEPKIARNRLKFDFHCLEIDSYMPKIDSQRLKHRHHRLFDPKSNLQIRKLALRLQIKTPSVHESTLRNLKYDLHSKIRHPLADRLNISRKLNFRGPNRLIEVKKSAPAPSTFLVQSLSPEANH